MLTNEQIQALKAAESDKLALKMKAAASQALEAWNKFLSLPDDVDLELDLSLYEVSLISDHDAASNPVNILSLLAEREADKTLIAELIGHLRNAHAFIENTEAFGQEAATGIISCGGAKWNIDASKAALVNSPRETRALTVKLPEALMPAQHNSGELFMTPDNVEHGGYLNRDDVIRVLRAAGITLIVGE